MRILVSIIIVTLLPLAASQALAGPRDHADGFFLRLSAGGGSASSEISGGGDKLKLSGTAGDVDIAIGAIVAPNLALHGTLLGWSISDPDAEFNGADVGTADGDLTAAGFGAGLTYYVMPANIYLTGTIGSGSLEFDAGNLSGETDNGLILGFGIGKEWWVSDGWALGAAFGLTHHSFNDPDVDEPWSGTSYTLRFTATMN